MLNQIVNSTDQYLEKFPKHERKKIGQFFTYKNTAIFMTKMFKGTINKDLRILDPGAGTGILSGALIDRLQDYDLNSIHLVMYENDENILPTLESNCKYLIESSKIPLTIDLVKKNFILDNEFENSLFDSNTKFDLIISNPPYKKIPKKAPEAQKMLNVVYGSPNLYFLFMAMSLHLLKENGEMVFIIPRSWTSGNYFKTFRKYLLKNGEINNIHLFINRNNLFKQDSILQETIIIKVSKSHNNPEFINISSSNDFMFDDLKRFKFPYELAVSKDENSYIFLPTNQSEVNVLKMLNKFEYNLIDLGIKLKTGLTVGFRNKELLCDNQCQEAVPLFYPCHFNEGFVEFPVVTDKKQYILKNKTSLLQDNKNFLFLKRFTTKEEKRRLQPAIYLHDSFREFNYISTDNKINFIDTINKNDNLTLSEIYGLFVLFNSTLYDKYYRILDGSTQVNANEINSMPVPDRNSLKQLGDKIIHSNNLTTYYCDKILGELIHG
ncbi:Eco57I restriction-modification methylase domain-containing protein [uncultured Methanobrevibacter sp.]|uniref:Eco57I restriction-modification methylase domain-containing protein n=1 Tax=uncultured Methanobrevibacter sp. TaxID=253161 RepID=UPI002615A7FA|nr:N-6 DNA methylase [uncultured Methanobrevibacter sp.]